MEVVEAEVENEMILVGSTAIEDRLQENVKETIEGFTETGIKVWVLTGDKVETAINIGYSCGLLNSSMRQDVINTTEDDVIKSKLTRVMNESADKENSIGEKSALVIAGEALTKVQESIELKDLFLTVTDRMDVVIACRVSPKQKGDIV